MKEDNYRRVAHNIFVKLLFTLNTFGKIFLDETDESDNDYVNSHLPSLIQQIPMLPISPKKSAR